VAQAADLCARGLPVDLVLLNVQPPPTLYEVMVAHDRDRLDELRAAAGADLLAPALALAHAAGLEPRHDVIGGDPADAIVEFAETAGAALLVLGHRGTVEGSQALGTTAREVLERAPMPVMVVRVAAGPAADPAESQA
jgi:nucleotide-binding universal stress UspA family protein